MLKTIIMRSREDQFIATVAKRYEVDLRSKSRRRPEPQIRQAVSYFLRERSLMTLEAVGAKLNQSHSNVHCGLKGIELMMEEHDEYNPMFKEVEVLYNNAMSPMVADIMWEMRHRSDKTNKENTDYKYYSTDWEK